MKQTWRQDRLRTINRHSTALAWELSGRPPAGEPQTYRVSFPILVGPRDLPVEGCKGMSGMSTGLRVYFLYSHVRDTMVILDEGNLPHSQCPCCDILMPWAALNGHHPNTAQCTKGEE